EAFDRVEPVLRLMGKTITYCGPSGAGQLTKLVNQILVSVNLLATCEALAFAKKNGLDPAKTIEAVGGGAAASWQLLNLGPKSRALFDCISERRLPLLSRNGRGSVGCDRGFVEFSVARQRGAQRIERDRIFIVRQLAGAACQTLGVCAVAEFFARSRRQDPRQR